MQQVEEASRTAPGQAFQISERAAQRIAELKATEADASLMLRITVSGGGCAGFQYGFDFDDKVGDEDLLFERDGVRVVIDEMSLGLLAGGELDYKENLLGSFFSIENPNATSSCGCGTSFSIG